MNDVSCHSSVTVMIQHLEWQTLEARRQQAWLMMFYLIIHDLVDISTNPYLTRAPLTTRRHQVRFIQPWARVQCYKYSFFPVTITTWNQLPNTAVSAPSREASGTAWPLLLSICAKWPSVFIYFSCTCINQFVFMHVSQCPSKHHEWKYSNIRGMLIIGRRRRMSLQVYDRWFVNTFLTWWFSMNLITWSR